MNYLNDKIQLFKEFLTNEIIKDNQLKSLQKYKDENINKFDTLDIEEQNLINTLIDNPKKALTDIDNKYFIQLIEYLPTDKDFLKSVFDRILQININEDTLNKLVIHIDLLQQIKKTIILYISYSLNPLAFLYLV